MERGFSLATSQRRTRFGVMCDRISFAVAKVMRLSEGMCSLRSSLRARASLCSLNSAKLFVPIFVFMPSPSGLPLRRGTTHGSFIADKAYWLHAHHPMTFMVSVSVVVTEYPAVVL